MNRLSRAWVWVKANRYFIAAGVVILLVVALRVLLRRKQQVSVAVQVSDVVKDAAVKHDETVIKAVEQAAEARGTEDEVQRQIEDVLKDTDGKRRRRRLAAMLREQNNG